MSAPALHTCAGSAQSRYWTSQKTADTLFQCALSCGGVVHSVGRSHLADWSDTTLRTQVAIASNAVHTLSEVSNLDADDRCWEDDQVLRDKPMNNKQFKRDKQSPH